jgi:drug/metabolite transporter (DMT)-like permease
MELKQKIQASYLAVMVIWSTTPLAIQWSSKDISYLFGVTARMTIGLGVSLLLLRVLGLTMQWHRQARLTYLAAGLGIYAAMLCVYWGAQYIPSGWISVLFGLTPIITGVMARRFLGEEALRGIRLLGVFAAISGLVVVFYGSLQFSENAWYGVLALLLSVTLHSGSMVWTKFLGYQGHGLVIVTGGLLVAVPLYLLTWIVLNEPWPQHIPERVGWAILYLGIVATVLGFGAFYFVLRHVDATRVALLTLMTPILALWLGRWLNDEQLTWTVIAGTLLILFGLLLYEFGQWKKQPSEGR